MFWIRLCHRFFKMIDRIVCHLSFLFPRMSYRASNSVKSLLLLLKWNFLFFKSRLVEDCICSRCSRWECSVFSKIFVIWWIFLFVIFPVLLLHPTILHFLVLSLCLFTLDLFLCGFNFGKQLLPSYFIVICMLITNALIFNRRVSFR